MFSRWIFERRFRRRCGRATDGKILGVWHGARWNGDLVRSPRLRSFLACVSFAGLARAAAPEARVAEMFRPLQAEWIALSPDGQRVAYSVRREGALELVIVPLDAALAPRRVRLERDGDAGEGRQPIAELRFLRWATATRLVYAPPERVVPLPAVVGPDGRPQANRDGPTIQAPVLALDADGRQRGVLVDARQFMETPAEARTSLADFLRTAQEIVRTARGTVGWRMPHLDILGFLPQDREQLVIGTRGAHSPPALHLVDVRTGGVREFGGEWTVPPPAPAVFDPFRLQVVGERRRDGRTQTRWTDRELAAVQGQLEAKFPRRTVEVIEWSETRGHVLCRVTGGRDPGRFFVLQRAEDIVVEVARRAPWLEPAAWHETIWVEASGVGGAPSGGYFTRPARNRQGAPPPLVVMLTADAEPESFDPEVQLLAERGWAVLRVAVRAGAGDEEDEAAGRLTPEVLRRWIAGMAAGENGGSIDVGRVALVGRGAAGGQALRLRERGADVFCCAAVIDPRRDGRESRAGTLPLLVLAAEEFAGGEAVHVARLEPGFAAGLPAARAAAVRRLADFLAGHFAAAPPAGVRAKEGE